MNNQIQTSKPLISLVVLGHVDHGKSTTLGHFLHELGIIDSRNMDKLESEAETLGMASWKWAFVLDSLPEERERGLTEDIAFFPFETSNRRFLLIDAPGHRDFVKNALRGAAQADACILMVSANPSDLKSGLKLGSGDGNPGGQTREHTILASVLGVQEVCIAINKMDTVKYNEKQYLETIDTIKRLLQEIQSPWVRKLEQIPFVPISGFEGDNLTKRSINMPWYQGPTLLEALDSMNPPNIRQDQTFRFLVQDAYEKPGVGTVIDGRIVSGTISVGNTVLVQPGGISGIVKDLWLSNGEAIDSLAGGEHGIVNLQGIDDDILEQPGLVIGEPEESFGVADKITSRLLILESMGRPITPGANFVMHIGTSYSSAQIISIDKIERENPRFSKLKRKNPATGLFNLVFPSELALVTLQPTQPIVAEAFEDHPVLGRTILRHMGSTVAVGIIQKVILG